MENKDKIGLTKENIKKLTDFIPYFESKDSQFFSIDSRDLFYPYVYSGRVNEFERALYDENIIIVFDWPGWQKEAKKYFDDCKNIEEADMGIIRKLLTLIIRKERFCSGFLAVTIESGCILAILKRLRDISASIG